MTINSIDELREYLDRRLEEIEIAIGRIKQEDSLLYGHRLIVQHGELKGIRDMLPEEEDTPYKRMIEGRLDWGEDEY